MAYFTLFITWPGDQLDPNMIGNISKKAIERIVAAFPL
jgi:hypothetical protein